MPLRRWITFWYIHMYKLGTCATWTPLATQRGQNPSLLSQVTQRSHRSQQRAEDQTGGLANSECESKAHLPQSLF